MRCSRREDSLSLGELQREGFFLAFHTYRIRAVVTPRVQLRSVGNIFWKQTVLGRKGDGGSWSFSSAVVLTLPSVLSVGSQVDSIQY